MKQFLVKMIQNFKQIQTDKYMHSEIASTIAFITLLVFSLLGPVVAFICSFTITSVCILVKDYYIDETFDIFNVIAGYIGAAKIWLILILFI